jgi:hypothetical protein
MDWHSPTRLVLFRTPTPRRGISFLRRCERTGHKRQQNTISHDGRIPGSAVEFTQYGRLQYDHRNARLFVRKFEKTLGGRGSWQSLCCQFQGPLARRGRSGRGRNTGGGGHGDGNRKAFDEWISMTDEQQYAQRPKRNATRKAAAFAHKE